MISYDRIALSVYAPDFAALKMIALSGQGADSFYRVGLMLDYKKSHHGWVFQHQKPIVRRDLRSEAEFQVEQPNIQEGIRSYCAVPLIARGESVGVFIVLSADKNRYATAHAEFLQEASDEFVLAIKSLAPTCAAHVRTKLVCPRCIASVGGQATAARHKDRLSEWDKQGGRGRKKLPSGPSQIWP